MIKAILWDNDGVLVDTEHLYYQANRDVFAEQGIDFTLEMYVEYSLRRGTSSLDCLLGDTRTKEEIEALKKDRNSQFSKILSSYSEPLLVEGVDALLKQLSGRYQMAIVTSCRKEHFKLIHRQTNILHHFDFILSSGDYERSKPHPDPYLAALNRVGLAPEECLVVEDTERGLIAARAAGLRCAVVPNKLAPDADYSAAVKVLGNLTELEPLLDEL